jgi:glycosyltransferase involved in cell wall biosynthesis
VKYKNMHRVFPAILDVLNEYPDLRACIIGDGPERAVLQEAAGGHPRVEFKGNPSDQEVRHYLRRTKLFMSGHTTEGFGISYLEALSQGCVVAMPASGGGVEIALARVGNGVQLLPISLDRREVLEVFRRALKVQTTPMSMEPYSPAAVASAYLEVDRCFFGETATSTQEAHA